MKRFCIFAVAFLLAGICSVTAQDLIVLKNGNMIEAKVTEISPTEIRYKRFDNLDGPTIVIPVADVLSIRYENGTYEIFNAVTTTEQESDQTEKPQTTAMNPDKLNFGFSIDPSGFLLNGPSINMEFNKGKSYTGISLFFPSLGLIFSNNASGGFGALVMFNYFWHNRNGGAYLGGGIGGVYYRYSGYWWTDWPFGVNVGYKFVASSGFYLRLGGFLGGRYSFYQVWDENDRFKFYFKPDVTIGLTSRGYARNLTPQTYSTNFKHRRNPPYLR